MNFRSLINDVFFDVFFDIFSHVHSIEFSLNEIDDFFDFKMFR